ncbi:MAG: hypothetical protein KDE09_04590 [Anaerolineales bacterium]|nr:hypothetical protein [Anaerolineales bacterium]
MKHLAGWLTIFLLSLLFIAPVRATDPVFSVDWDQKLGGADADFANEVLPTSDGGYLAVGVNGVANDLSFYVVKLTAVGDIAWEQTLSLSLSGEYAYDLVETNDGYVIIGEANILSPHQSRPWLVKLSPSGEILWSTENSWTQTLPVSSGIVVGAAAGDGQVFVAGGSNTMTNPQDPWVVKVDAHGDLIFYRELEPLATGFGQGTYVLDMVATPDGGFALTGTVSPPSLGEAYLWKFDANGHEEWVQTYGGLFFRAAHSVRLAANGDYLLAGCDLPNCSNTALLRADAAGNMLWYREFEDANDYSNGWDIIERADGSLILLQQRFDAYGTTTFASDLLHLNATGDLLHGMTISGGDRSTALRRLHLTAQGFGWIAAGNSNETTNGSAIDFYLVRGSFMDMNPEAPLTYRVMLPIIRR